MKKLMNVTREEAMQMNYAVRTADYADYVCGYLWSDAGQVWVQSVSTLSALESDCITEADWRGIPDPDGDTVSVAEAAICQVEELIGVCGVAVINDDEFAQELDAIGYEVTPCINWDEDGVPNFWWEVFATPEDEEAFYRNPSTLDVNGKDDATDYYKEAYCPDPDMWVPEDDLAMDLVFDCEVAGEITLSDEEPEYDYKSDCIVEITGDAPTIKSITKSIWRAVRKGKIDWVGFTECPKFNMERQYDLEVWHERRSGLRGYYAYVTPHADFNWSPEEIEHIRSLDEDDEFESNPIWALDPQFTDNEIKAIHDLINPEPVVLPTTRNNRLGKFGKSRWCRRPANYGFTENCTISNKVYVGGGMAEGVICRY